MPTKLICPDCGGVLGEAGEGEAVCTCFTDSAPIVSVASQRTAIQETAAHEAAGHEAAGHEAAGHEAAGHEKAGHETLGGLDLSNETAGGASLNDTQPVEVVTKVCFKCGADVRGHRRFKDSRGYLCAECNAREVAAEKEGMTSCPECGRRVRDTALVEFRGRRICKLCINDLRENDKKRVKIVSTKNYANEDRRKLMIMVGVLVVLGILMLISAWRVLHGRV